MNNFAKFVIGGLIAGYLAIAGTVYYVSEPPASTETQKVTVAAVKPAESQVRPEEEVLKDGPAEKGITKEPVVEEEIVSKPAETPAAVKVAEAPSMPETVREKVKDKIAKIWPFKKKEKPVVTETYEEIAPKLTPPKPAKRIVVAEEPAAETRAAPRKFKDIDFSSKNPREWKLGKCSSDIDVKTLKECEWHRNLLPHRMNPATEGR